MKPMHEELPLVTRTLVELPDEMHRIISLLNQHLKAKGYVFGLRRLETDQYEFSMYDLNQDANNE